LIKSQEIIYYDIHGLLRIHFSLARVREFITDINQPFSYFRSQEFSNPDIILNVGDFTPRKNPCDIVNNKVYINNGYVFSSEIIDKHRCSFELIGLDTPTTIVNASTYSASLKNKLFPSLMSQNLFLRPIVDYKLLQKDILSIHAAGVSQGDQAIVFCGRGGSFKTTLVMDMIRKSGLRFIGEDRLLLGFDSTVYSYPIYPRLFEYRLKHMPTEDFGRFDKLRYVLFQRISKSEREHIDNRSRLKTIISLVKHTRKTVEYTFLSKKEMVARILKNQQSETITSPGIMKMSSGRFYEYLSAYAYSFPYSEPANYWKGYQDLLDSILPDKEYLEIYLPVEYQPDFPSQIISILMKEREL